MTYLTIDITLGLIFTVEYKMNNLGDNIMSLGTRNTAYVSNLLDFEIERLRPQPLLDYEPGTDAARFVAWAMSTQTRRMFGSLMTRAAMDNKRMCAGFVRSELQISRPSINEMINQCEDAGWISVKRDERGYRWLKGAPLLPELWEEYAMVLGERVLAKAPVVYTSLEGMPMRPPC